MVRLSCCIGALALFVACSPSAPQDTRLSPGRAGFALELVDAPNPQVREINVTIARVTAHSTTDGWVEIFNQGPVTVDLLTLKTRVMDLGFRNLPAGKITQIRLYLVEGGTQNVVLPGGEVVPLKVPSGVQSGIKIKGPFELSSCDVTTVTLDFDGHKSIWYHPTGNGGDWILRPVIRTKRVRSASTPCDGPIVGSGGGNGSTGGGSGSTGGGTGTGTGGGFIEIGGGNGSGGGSGSGLPLQPGLDCSLNSQCLSGMCAAGVCAFGAQGTPCGIGHDCVSGTCGADGSCTAPVSTQPLGPTGTVCTSGSQCVSGVCAGGSCSAGLQGQPCQATGDCDMGFVCAAGACEPEIN